MNAHNSSHCSGLPVQHWLAEEAYIYFAAELSFFLSFFLCQNLYMRIGPSGGCRYCTNSGAPALLIKYPQTSDPCCPLFTGGKCAKFWPIFRPQSSSHRRIFGLGRFVRKQKQNCQGPMIGLPPYQTWGGWVPLPRTVGAMGARKGKSGKFFTHPPFQRPTPSTAPLMLYHQLGDIAAVKILPCHISQFAPTVHRGSPKKAKVENFLYILRFSGPPPPMLYHTLGCSCCKRLLCRISQLFATHISQGGAKISSPHG